jgi:hypothetical protein
VVVAVRLSPEAENTITVFVEVEAVVLSTHSAVHVPAKKSVVTLADSSLVLVERLSPQPVDMKMINVSNIRYLFII